MIVYSESKQQFCQDVMNGTIANQLILAVRENLGHHTGNSEVNSWRNSLLNMHMVVNDPAIPDDCHVALEYKIPATNNRIDFIISGQGEDSRDVAVIIELKQWSSAELVDKDGVLAVPMGYGHPKEMVHPSYQAWSYAALLKNFNEAVYEGEIKLQPCAYLHNYTSDNVIDHSQFQHYIERAPLFLAEDRIRLQNFIKQHVKYGDKNNLIYQIENGKIRPSKALADALASMLRGNPEFVMIDEQKVVYEAALRLARIADENHKQVLIVNGGPGTGKSVVAINLLQNLTKQRLNTHYVSKNSAPRAVFEYKLTGTYKKTEISNLFKGSGGYINQNESQNTFDALIVDESHRLNQRSGLFSNLGENQIKEIINAAKFSVFFVDEDQIVTLKDIGTSSEIRRCARDLGASVHELALTSQFRCNGSDGYLAWLDNTLQIRETPNETMEGIDYDFQVIDTPQELHQLIKEKNRSSGSARIVAGYCWDWKEKSNPDYHDIQIPEHNFSIKWNLDRDGGQYLVKPSSIDQAGCIHTVQGLELEYVGVIIGDDLIVRDGQIVTNPAKRARTDQSIRGWKKLMEQDPVAARSRLDIIIKNTYRTLMTRGSKGCYIFCTDVETAEYFKSAFG